MLAYFEEISEWDLYPKNKIKRFTYFSRHSLRIFHGRIDKTSLDGGCHADHTYSNWNTW